MGTTSPVLTLYIVGVTKLKTVVLNCLCFSLSSVLEALLLRWKRRLYSGRFAKIASIDILQP